MTTETVEFKDLTPPQQLAYLGTDAQKWAEEFAAEYRLDPGAILTWFANAIEAGREAGRTDALASADPLAHAGPDTLDHDIDVLGALAKRVSQRWVTPLRTIMYLAARRAEK